MLIEKAEFTVGIHEDHEVSHDDPYAGVVSVSNYTVVFSTQNESVMCDKLSKSQADEIYKKICNTIICETVGTLLEANRGKTNENKRT